MPVRSEADCSRRSILKSDLLEEENFHGCCMLQEEHLLCIVTCAGSRGSIFVCCPMLEEEHLMYMCVVACSRRSNCILYLVLENLSLFLEEAELYILSVLNLPHCFGGVFHWMY